MIGNVAILIGVRERERMVHVPGLMGRDASAGSLREGRTTCSAPLSHRASYVLLSFPSGGKSFFNLLNFFLFF